MKSWHILADDLTGALDSAAAWAKAGDVPVFLDEPGPSAQDVQVVATGTRDVPPASLPALLAPSLDWLVATGSAFKKIDSLLRGNTFAEIAWLMRSGRFAGVVFAPAFPAQGRFTARGRHWVAPPHQPHDQRTHEHACTLVQAFSNVGLSAHIPNRVQDSLQDAGKVAIPDILNDHDLDQLATLTVSPQAQPWLWCGSAGLAWALARQGAAASPASATSVAPPPPAQGLTLVLTASRHPVLREQLRHLPPIEARTEVLDLAEAQPLSPTEAQTRLTQRMHTVVTTRPRPATLVVVGGDTLLALCRAADVRSLQAGASPCTGWGRARLVGGPWDGLSCYSRSGAFGPPDDLRALLAALTPHATPTDEGTPHMNTPIRLALTMGDPAGIGPEIIVKAAHQMRDLVAQGRIELKVLGSAQALEQAARLLQLDTAALDMIDVGPVTQPLTVGQISEAGGHWAYRAVERAVQLCQSGEADAIVTAPLCKEALHMAGYPFEGHTEMLAHLTGMRDGVMMLAHGPMRVSHVTTHCALAEVPARLTPQRLRRVLDVTLEALHALGIKQPRVAVAGLNPHAGEGGILGKEDGAIIAPLVAEYAAAGQAVTGPWPGDTVFIKLRAEQFDAVVAMYHDQGHIPVKLLGFSIDPATGVWQSVSGVNITLGLPILRTSVDHGTAFDIAGTGRASAESMVDAIQYAMTLVEGRRTARLAT